MTDLRLVQYYHPKRGGWYYAYMIKAGRKWARLAVIPTRRSVRVPVRDVREVTGNG